MASGKASGKSSSPPKQVRRQRAKRAVGKLVSYTAMPVPRQLKPVSFEVLADHPRVVISTSGKRGRPKKDDRKVRAELEALIASGTAFNDALTIVCSDRRFAKKDNEVEALRPRVSRNMRDLM